LATGLFWDEIKDNLHAWGAVGQQYFYHSQLLGFHLITALAKKIRKVVMPSFLTGWILIYPK